MSTFIIELHPRKAAYDPLAKAVKAELLEAGEAPEQADVNTQRLVRLEGELTLEQVQSAADILLVDPLVESIKIEGGEKTKKKSIEKKGKTALVLDVWPKNGVTDPVGETIEKGLRDLGIRVTVHAHAGIRYVFPKIKNVEILKRLAKQNLANEMIHDIVISKSN